MQLGSQVYAIPHHKRACLTKSANVTALAVKACESRWCPAFPWRNRHHFPRPLEYGSQAWRLFTGDLVLDQTNHHLGHSVLEDVIICREFLRLETS
ncbi:hypothetical protein BaRGS_00006601 [Batillaria attramentaria]|uniref:Uncharacterized protein n=1 Tax=Batillaria attramentaria TaxID=370345 RepID=A0ABD0LSA2_9CAEN